MKSRFQRKGWTFGKFPRIGCAANRSRRGLTTTSPRRWNGTLKEAPTNQLCSAGDFSASRSSVRSLWVERCRSRAGSAAVRTLGGRGRNWVLSQRAYFLLMATLSPPGRLQLAMPETHFTQWGPTVRVRNRGLVVGEEGSNGQGRCEDLDIPSLFCFFSLCSFFLFRRVGVTPV